uniref:Uncharacterized protein n=1 Tax=Zea mays TaxID=4577 RepID=A0A804U6Q9_MAIZE
MASAKSNHSRVPKSGTKQRLLAPAALRPRTAQPPGPGAVDDPPEKGGERERHARRAHQPCGGPKARARGDWQEARKEAADAVPESTSLSAVAVACVPSDGAPGRWKRRRLVPSLEQ